MDTLQQLEKARIWAYWGFIGLLVPVAGIIASAVSLSILNRLVVDEDEPDVIEEHAQLRQMANLAKSLSGLFLVLMVIGGILAAATVSDQLSKAQQASEAAQKAADDTLKNYSNYP